MLIVLAKALIEAAIARGQGKSLSGAMLEALTFEFIMPGNVGVVVECETDNRLQALQLLRTAVKKAGGNASPSGFLFDRRGRVTIDEAQEYTVDDVLEHAIEASALDVMDEDGAICILTEPETTQAVAEHVSQALGLPMTDMTTKVVWHVKEETATTVSNPQAKELSALLDVLEESEAGVQAVYMNLEQGELERSDWADLRSRLE